MSRIILVFTIMVSGLVPQQLIFNSNQVSNSGELQNIIERASRTSQKVFVEDFTGLS